MLPITSEVRRSVDDLIATSDPNAAHAMSLGTGKFLATGGALVSLAIYNIIPGTPPDLGGEAADATVSVMAAGIGAILFNHGWNVVRQRYQALRAYQLLGTNSTRLNN